MRDGVSYGVALKESEYRQIRDMVYRRFGINLTEQKKSLIVGRLNGVIRKLGLSSFEEYLNFVERDSSGHALETLIDRISTNHTFFYREFEHFEFFRDTALPQILPLLALNNEKDLRIWIAGCSSGEEAYFAAMILQEYFSKRPNRPTISILATDIASSALETAKRGTYTKQNVEKLPARYRNAYFRKISLEEYQVVDQLKKIVFFRKLNLIQNNYPFKNQFYAIFCRNVMIYFDKNTRNNLVSRFYNYLVPGGYFFIGHSETLGQRNQLFSYVRPAVYRKDPIQ